MSLTYVSFSVQCQNTNLFMSLLRERHKGSAQWEWHHALNRGEAGKHVSMLQALSTAIKAHETHLCFTAGENYLLSLGLK